MAPRPSGERDLFLASDEAAQITGQAIHVVSW
jgi:hypothetical protein